MLLIFLPAAQLAGQDGKVKTKPVPPSEGVGTAVDTTKRSFLRIVSADNQIYDATGEDERYIINGNVRITHDSVYMFCDTAVLVNGTDLQAKGNVTIIKNDTIKIFSDSLLYQSDSLMAYFVGNVVLQDGKQQLFTSFLQYDLERDWAIYTDTALLIADGMEIKSKRGIFHLDENYVNFYEKVTIEGQDFNLLSDSLRYYTEIKRAIFLSPTLISQGAKEIYSEGGYYDIDDKESLFFGNAQYREGDKTSTADTIKNYEVDGGRTVLIGDAVYQSADELGKAQTITYFSGRDEIELVGDAYFKNSENEVTGDRIFFQTKTNSVRVRGRSTLSNPPMLIVADDLDYQKEVGIAIAHGNIIWKDTSANYEIICDHAFYTDSTDHMKAYNDVGKPLLINAVSEDDTLYLSGDTLISYTQSYRRDSITVDTHRHFRAYAHVEMLTSEMQATADSLVYDGRDSTFTLLSDPYMWSDSSQYSADTIVISMKDDDIERVDLLQSAMIISTTDFEFFDQVKGKVINAYFQNDNIEKMTVTGGSQSIYYMKDDEDAYMGVNETTCTNMIFIFEGGELLQTRYYKEPISKMTPMKKANHSAMQLNGFKWQIDRRPLEISDLLD